MRVLIIGDGIRLTTGFSQVLRHCVATFVRRGWEVAQIASLHFDADPAEYRSYGVELFKPVFPDFNGYKVLPDALAWRPDVIMFNIDPGTGVNWLRILKEHGSTVPTVMYAPVEGAPLSPSYALAFQQATQAITYTRWSADVLRDAYGLEIPWVYHGVDTDVFHPVGAGKRSEIRRQLGWTGRFVVAYVARNAQRKAHDRLIKALAELRAHGETDVLLYLHCKRFDRHQLQGWDLGLVCAFCGVSDHVQFSDQERAEKGIDAVSLAEKYAAADLYVHVAKVEGFGLPIIEAMACGLPVVVPKDYGNMEEVAGAAVAAKIEPIDWETWFNGAQLANLSPEHIGLTIRQLKNQPALLKMAQRRSLDHAQNFSWWFMARTIADAVESVAARQVVSA